MTSLPMDCRLVHLAETASTNAEAMRLGLMGEASGLWVLADLQTAGRGRSGRAWTSAPGNLHASLLTRLTAPAPKANELALVAGVALFDAIRASGVLPDDAALRLKWPNDVLIAAEKVGGILIESSAQAGSAALLAVTGIGLNLTSEPKGLDRPVAHLARFGETIQPLEMLAFLAASMQNWLTVWNEGPGFHAVRAAWLERGGRLGEHLRVNTGQGTVAGTFGGLGPDGSLLIVDANGEQRAVTHGDVSLVG